MARRRRVGDEVIVAAPERASRGKKTRKYKKRTRNTSPEIRSTQPGTFERTGGSEDVRRTRGEKEGGDTRRKSRKRLRISRGQEERPQGRRIIIISRTKAKGEKQITWEMKKRFPFPPGLELPLPPDAAYKSVIFNLGCHSNTYIHTVDSCFSVTVCHASLLAFSKFTLPVSWSIVSRSSLIFLTVPRFVLLQGESGSGGND